MTLDTPPVARLVTSTFAPETAAPFGSVTLPTRAPYSTCATVSAGMATSRQMLSKVKNRNRRDVEVSGLAKVNIDVSPLMKMGISHLVRGHNKIDNKALRRWPERRSVSVKRVLSFLANAAELLDRWGQVASPHA